MCHLLALAWAMGMPFMKRVTKAQLAKNPKLKGLDVERTKQSCRNFRNNPTTIINFVEDKRIDNFIYSTAPGYQLYYEELYRKSFYNKIVDKINDGELSKLLTDKPDEEHHKYECKKINQYPK